jgi:hypothetical protein
MAVNTSPIVARTAEQIQTQLKDKRGAVELHAEAIDRGMSLSRFLDLTDPSPEGTKLDAFQRQLRLAGIITRSNPRQGYWASEGEAFLKDSAGRALFAEFFAREYRKVSFATTQQRAAILLSSDYAINTAARPYENDGGPFWEDQVAAPIPLSEIVALTTSINGEDYRSMYMTYDAAAVRMFRIGESADIPVATLTSSEKTIRLRKYGRGIRATYEQLRRTKIDKIAWWIRWVALQAEIDKVAAAMAILVAGDGNSNTAATEYNLLTLDPDATANELSLLGWLNFRLQWAPPYTPTTALMRVEEALQLILLNTGSANIPLQGANFNGVGNQLTPINPTADSMRYGWTSEAPDGKIVAFDKRAALEHITEIGGDITETERFILNQTEVMVMTEVSAFAVLDASATKVLDLSE